MKALYLAFMPALKRTATRAGIESAWRRWARPPWMNRLPWSWRGHRREAGRARRTFVLHRAALGHLDQHGEHSGFAHAEETHEDVKGGSQGGIGSKLRVQATLSAAISRSIWRRRSLV
jgi:hypothetical protein